MKLTEQLKQALSSLAHAEAGEMLSRREKWQAISHEANTPTPLEDRHSAISPRKLVALSIGSHPSHTAVQYAISVCQRMGADLSMLCTHARASETVLSKHQGELDAANITCRTVVISGKPERAIKQYLQTHPQLIFIVSGCPDDPVQMLISKGQWNKFVNPASVPVVVTHDHVEQRIPHHEPISLHALAMA